MLRGGVTACFETRAVAILTAPEFFYIFYLETVITSSAKTAKFFGMSMLASRLTGVSRFTRRVFRAGLASDNRACHAALVSLRSYDSR